MKKVFATLLALVLVLAACTSAMAETIITINPQIPEYGTTDGTETYMAYQIFEASISGDNVAYTIAQDSPFYSTIASKNEYFTLTPVVGTEPQLYTVDPTDSFKSDAAAKALASALQGVITSETKGTSAIWNEASKNYTINVGSDGYYLVTSSLGSALILDTFDTQIITTKNKYPSVTKTIVSGATKVDSITADRGNTITFEITVTIPETVNDSITVHDKLDTGMTYVGLVGTPAGVTEVKNTDDDCTVEFTIDYTKASENKVTFQYTATLNGDAAIGTEHKNEAWITYSSFTSVHDKVSVFTYEIPVFKYHLVGQVKTGLPGAGFVLKNADGKYYTNNNGIVTWVDELDNATEQETTESATTVKFDGLANGTYTLVEKTVPTGYNPASNTTVVIADGKVTVNGTEVSQVEVLNSTGSELPSTGGIGTTIFYVVGGLLMAGALVLLITKKKVSAK